MRIKDSELILNLDKSIYHLSLKPENIATAWHARWGGLIDRLSFYAPYRADPERWAEILADLKKLPTVAQ